MDSSLVDALKWFTEMLHKRRADSRHWTFRWFFRCTSMQTREGVHQLRLLCRLIY